MRARRERERGQSLVELAIFAPIMIVLFLAIGDVARGFATMIAIESAAREAADWGAFRPGNWDPDVPQAPITVAEMERRACTAALALPEYEGDANGATCTNPTFECGFGPGDPDPAFSPCDPPTSLCFADPDGDGDREYAAGANCRVKVILTYEFDLVAPSEFLALPSTFTFNRTSTFAVGKDPEST